MSVRLVAIMFVFVSFNALLMSTASAKWNGDAGLGFVSATGNERSSSAHGSADLSYSAEPWTHNLLGDYYRSAENGEPTQARSSIGYKADRQLGGAWYAWGAVRYERDEFADINRRWAALLGIGHKFIDNEQHELGAEFGLGHRDIRFVSLRTDSEETVASLGINYRGRLSETVSVSERLLVESGEDNTHIVATTGITIQLSDRLALNFSHALRRNSDIPGSNGGKTNSLTTVKLLLTF